MSKYKKSAKDLAFEKERNKLNKRIRELESLEEEKDLEIIKLHKTILEKEKERLTLKLENEKLLSLNELSKEDLENVINKANSISVINKVLFSGPSKVIGAYNLNK